MTPELENKLSRCSTLPSPPQVASELIELANVPDTEIQDVVKILQKDPALSLKILRVANSPMYANQRKIATLDQATLTIGLNGILALALSFSLVKSFRSEKTAGLDYPLFWKRAMISASISRAIGESCALICLEELFMATLIQDIGMLALDRAYPQLYADSTLDQAWHSRVVSHEQQSIGASHGSVGCWLLSRWNFPERLQMAVSTSDAPDRLAQTDDRLEFSRCVTLSGLIAELYLTKAKKERVMKVANQANEWLGMTAEAFTGILEKLEDAIAESEKLFDCHIHDEQTAELLLETAKETLLVRNMQAIQQVENLQYHTIMLESRYQNLEETSRLDSLTGAYNRSFLDDVIEATFQSAITNATSLSFLFVDLDNFKKLNDTYGHQTGDSILMAVGKTLKSQTRNTDFVGRYGGEEFFIIMPGVNTSMGAMVCERILNEFRRTTHDVGPDQSLIVTVSLGIATLEKGKGFQHFHEMIRAADKALYASKSGGRNRWTAFHSLSPSDTVQSTT
ncbi:MAG: GGDEF domain-containing protein [Nitrospirales bacterium]|nr:GGDEF domain-containing protein [Nitrospira sp.]MDR4501231.1 GGDEF domain-containing protein [Nitrospirales bacterium]